MAIKINNSNFEYNDTGMRTPSSADVTVDGSRFANNTIGIDIYLTSDNLAEVGLRNDTPKEIIDSVNSILISDRDKPKESLIKRLESSGIVSWINASASATSVIQAIAALAG